MKTDSLVLMNIYTWLFSLGYRRYNDAMIVQIHC